MKQLLFLILCLPKTLLFNLKYFPFKDAIRLPVFVSHRVWLKELSGTVKVSNVRTGAILIGFGDVMFESKTIWQVSGTVEFKGNAVIGPGSKIVVSGKLTIGTNFLVTATTLIIAHKSITIGDNVLFAWDTLIMDTDFHKIYDSSENRTNQPRSVKIGNKVWIGCRTVILKGVEVADGVVIGASSTLTKPIKVKNSIVGGNPAKIIRENITWEI